MIATYDVPRREAFFRRVDVALAAGKPFDAVDYRRRAVTFENDWASRRGDTFPVRESGDAVAVARRVFLKYREAMAGESADRRSVGTGGDPSISTRNAGRAALSSGGMKSLLTVVLALAPLAHAYEIKPDGSVELRVVSYNIRNGGRGMDGQWDSARTARVLAALKPDVVLMQEVDLNAKRSGKKDVAAAIAASLGMKSVFGRAMPYDGGGYGIAIATALPMTAVREIRMEGGTEPRLVLVADVKAGTRAFSVACAHLDYRNEPAVAKHAEKVATTLAAAPLPVILGGDFNFGPKSAVVAAFTSKGFAYAGKTGAPETFPADKPTTEIDHFVWSPKEAVVLRTCRVADEPAASDHRPLLLDVTLAPVAAK